MSFPQDEGRNSDLPGFTEEIPGEAEENSQDEWEILADQDVTNKITDTDDENMGAKSNSLDEFEDDEPDLFLTGEVDVKEQMDRAAEAMDSSIHGYQHQGFEDSPRTELGASFKFTPGGLEEVEEKTDQDLAVHNHSPHARPRPKKTEAEKEQR